MLFLPKCTMYTTCLSPASWVLRKQLKCTIIVLKAKLSASNFLANKKCDETWNEFGQGPFVRQLGENWVSVVCQSLVKELIIAEWIFVRSLWSVYRVFCQQEPGPLTDWDTSEIKEGIVHSCVSSNSPLRPCCFEINGSRR